MSKDFFNEIDETFKEILNVPMKKKIVIVDAATQAPVPGVKYDKLLFDSDLNAFKIGDDGKITKLNEKFKAIVKD